MTRNRFAGFTLIEALLSMALLGVVAAFTIPQILQSTQSTQSKTLYLDTLSEIQGVIYDGTLSGETVNSLSLTDYMAKKLNAIKTCRVNFQTEGCYTPRSPANALNGGGIVLPNGVTISDINTDVIATCTNAPTSDTCFDGWIVDINGSQGPNVEGTDYIDINLRWGGQPAVDPFGVYRQVGTFAPDPTSAANIALWKSLYH